MTRLPLIGALAAGLLTIGVLAPAVATASTHTAGTTAPSTAAGTTAPSIAYPIPQGSSLGPVFPAQSLLFLPQILGQVDRHR
jgi:hypothetical protein